jgi:hypothetical protein
VNAAISSELALSASRTNSRGRGPRFDALIISSNSTGSSPRRRAIRRTIHR